MAAKRKAKSKRKTKAQLHAQNQVLAIILCTLGLFLTFLAFVRGTDVWLSIHNVMLGLFGPAAYFIGPIFVYISVMASFDKLSNDLNIRAVLTTLLLCAISAACQIFISGPPAAETVYGVVRELYETGQALKGGGVASALFGFPLMKLGVPGDHIVISLILFALLMILTRSTIAGVLRTAKKPVDKLADSYLELVSALPLANHRADAAKAPVIDIPLDDEPPRRFASPAAKTGTAKQKLLSLSENQAAAPAAPQPPPPAAPAPEADGSPVEPSAEEAARQLHLEDILQRMANNVARDVEAAGPEGELPSAPRPEEETPDAGEAPDGASAEAIPDGDAGLPPAPAAYVLPSPSLLREPQLAAADASTSEELRQNAQRLVDTLQSFGVQTRIIDISRGPAVTRYELQPSAGVKISKITNLADDIALNLASAGVRIEAPIPNKAAVGIEVPNRTVSPVTLREVIDSRAFSDAKSRVTIALGRDISGNITVADIARMPHLLIAGATGSGKSVCINSIIMSILFKARPDEVKLMLVDPKVVELGVYNGLPHLVVPVVNDAKKAAGVLGWAVTEMLGRYKTFAQHGVRDITSFNKLTESRDDLEKLPHIVIVVDELSDLMMAAPADVEDHICRLAQMARAAGMHLIIATQRPSVDVITGIIKANIPSRVAFAVSSQIDSRTILDMGGAEKLLGMGDMLFYPVGASKPVRVQGCYVSDDEIERVTDFIKDSVTPQYDQEVIDEIERHTPVGKNTGGSSGNSDGGEEDGMISAAIECVVEAGIASTSLLQRKCKLGYARAARIIDELESRGIVGPFEGSKPRQVLISKERWIEMKLNQMQASDAE